jgi:multidrug transporter EmrE-like cation transporter
MRTTPFSSILLVFLAAFIGSFGAVFLKSGAGRLSWEWRAIFLNWRLAAGVASFLISSIFFVLALRDGELSVLYPFVALGYVWTLFWSRLFFGEPFTRYKLIGLGLILTGIVLLGIGRG